MRITANAKCGKKKLIVGIHTEYMGVSTWVPMYLGQGYDLLVNCFEYNI